MNKTKKYKLKLDYTADKLVPPSYKDDWWGIMPHYWPGKIGTIIKIDECPNCRRRLNE